MLSAQHRLRSAKDIARVYKQGTYGSGGGVLAAKAIVSGRATARAVVVVGKKIDKRAVVRNRLRRRLTELFRRHLETVRRGYDIVITVQADFRIISEPELEKNLLTALRRSNVIIDNKLEL